MGITPQEKTSFCCLYVCVVLGLAKMDMFCFSGVGVCTTFISIICQVFGFED